MGVSDWGFTHLLNNKLKHDLRPRAQIVHLHELGLVKAVVRSQGLEEAVRALVQRHGPVRVGFREGEGGVVCCLEVAQALGSKMLVVLDFIQRLWRACRDGGDGVGFF